MISENSGRFVPGALPSDESPILLGAAAVGSAFHVRIFDKRLSQAFTGDAVDCLHEGDTAYWHLSRWLMQ